MDWRKSAKDWVISVAWGKRVVLDLRQMGIAPRRATGLVAGVLAEQEGMSDPYQGSQAATRSAAVAAEEFASLRARSLSREQRREAKEWLLETVDAVLTSGGIVDDVQRQEVVDMLDNSFDASYRRHRAWEAVAVVRLFQAVARAGAILQRTQLGRRGSRPELCRFIVEVVDAIKALPPSRLPHWAFRLKRAKYQPSPYWIIETYLKRLSIQMLKKPVGKGRLIWTPTGPYTDKAVYQLYRQWSSQLSRLPPPLFP